MKNEEDYLKARPFISLSLMFLAFALLSVSWTFLMLFGIIYYASKESLVKYLYNVGVSVDKLLASMMFGTDGHTISAIVYKRKHLNSVKFIDWLFRDKEHCKSSYEKEYLRNKNE